MGIFNKSKRKESSFDVVPTIPPSSSSSNSSSQQPTLPISAVISSTPTTATSGNNKKNNIFHFNRKPKRLSTDQTPNRKPSTSNAMEAFAKAVSVPLDNEDVNNDNNNSQQLSDSSVLTDSSTRVYHPPIVSRNTDDGVIDRTIDRGSISSQIDSSHHPSGPRKSLGNFELPSTAYAPTHPSLVSLVPSTTTTKINDNNNTNNDNNEISNNARGKLESSPQQQPCLSTASNKTAVSSSSSSLSPSLLEVVVPKVVTSHRPHTMNNNHSSPLLLAPPSPLGSSLSKDNDDEPSLGISIRSRPHLRSFDDGSPSLDHSTKPDLSPLKATAPSWKQTSCTPSSILSGIDEKSTQSKEDVTANEHTPFKAVHLQLPSRGESIAEDMEEGGRVYAATTSAASAASAASSASASQTSRGFRRMTSVACPGFGSSEAEDEIRKVLQLRAQKTNSLLSSS